MYKTLRIIFTILSAIGLAAAIPLGMFFGLIGVFSALIGAGIFFFLMLLCKQNQESAEKKQGLAPDTENDGEESTPDAHTDSTANTAKK
ncbi:MAG: hypothetical protein E7352_06120 [Clostridiales bacterium]|nr:hypothetical protein [Clostridiales bacterium]